MALRKRKPTAARPTSKKARQVKPGERALARTSPIREAFWSRASTALRRIAEQADERSLQRAVAAPTDVGALARAISDQAALGSAVEELDPLAALIARGAEQKVELLKQAGGTLPVSDVAKLLGISRQAVDKRRREGKLLAVPRGTDYAYPACQFVKHDVVPGLGEVLEEMGTDSVWAMLAFLITPDDRLGKRSPLTALQHKEQRLKDMTLRLARVAAGDGFG